MKRGICGALVATVLVAACSAYAVSNAEAAPTGTITPYVHCADGSETVPAGQEIIIRSVWATGSWGNVQKFLDWQTIVWNFRRPNENPFASSGFRSHGIRTFWSTPTSFVGTINGQTKQGYRTTYLEPTGIVLAPGETVLLSYLWTTQKKLDDDFGTKIEPGILSIVNNCEITGV
jgi:hypothetical protein